MIVTDKDVRPENQRFVRHMFFEKRIIFLEGPMDESYANDSSMPLGWSTSPRGVIDQILYLANSDTTQPIRLYINSLGGMVTPYERLYDLMISLNLPIYTIAHGVVASAAVPILAAGAKGKRFIFQNSKTMIHNPSGGVVGDLKTIENSVHQMRLARRTYASILARHSSKSVEEIVSLLNRKRDYWMNAEETKSFGLVDHIVTDLAELKPTEKEN